MARDGSIATAVAFPDMGAPLEEVRQQLLAAARDLLREGTPESTPVIDRALQTLRQLTCRIAVIGQVKAGKSLFIGALVGRPHLLPSDANPWTTVVTSLHFVNRAPPAESALFTFFSSDEWHRIAAGGGPLRELTERLVPGFDAGLLSAQLDAMRRRAEQRLGKDFASLLGHSHSYSKVDPEVLARYVSAGVDDLGVSPGWYSDITKSADLRFASQRSGLPVTVIDTPGTNDPLLVRDEITRMSAATGDLFIVMLTAQQPLSSADVALLHLLRGLSKERIVVFINRIDGLADPLRDVERLVRHVRDRLGQEFPGAELPLVVGSASWASIAMAGQADEVEAALDPRVRSYAEARGLLVPPPGSPGESLRTALFALSGLPEVTTAVSRAMFRATAAQTLRQHAQLLFHFAQSREETARGEVMAHRRALQETGAGAEARARQLAEWRSELDQIDAAGRQLRENLAFYERSLASIVGRCGQDLRQLLRAALSAFIEEETDRLLDAYHDRSARVWRSDPAPLRKHIEAEFARIYGYWEGTLQKVDRQIMTELRHLMPHLGVGADGSAMAWPESPFLGAPDSAPLARTLAVDLALPWWQAWWSGQPTADEVARRLERLLKADFEPLIESLIDRASRTLDARSELAVRQARLCTLDIVESIHRRSEALLAGLREADDAARPAAEARIEAGLEDARAKLSRASDLRERLSAALSRCNSLVETGGAS